MMIFMLIYFLLLTSMEVMPSIVDEVREASSTADLCHGITVKDCGTSILLKRSTARIVGGRKVKKHGRYPWMVSIHEDYGNGFEHICGGSILNENWILTAAHCIDFVNEPWKYRAYAGLYKLSQLNAPTVQKIKISEIIFHEDFNNKTFANDIALLKTAQPINIAGSRGYVNGICLPRSNRDPTGYLQVTGWGHTYQDGENSNTLKESEVPIIPRDLCNEVYDDDPDDEFDEVTENMICAGMQQRDACQNDSGGPLIGTNRDGVSTLIGVVSHGSGCGERDYPGVYMKVSTYKQWIENKMCQID